MRLCGQVNACVATSLARVRLRVRAYLCVCACICTRVCIQGARSQAEQNFYENINIQFIQQTMRTVQALAEPNLRAFGIDPERMWDYAARHGMMQRRWLDRILAGEATYRQAARAVMAPFGAIGEVALLIGSPERQESKQQKK